MVPRNLPVRYQLACLLLPVLGLFLPLQPANAATHNVTVQNFTFSPANLNINTGDIVRWNWVQGMHTTTSGAGGVPDGTWNAPIDVANTTFQRTFNSAGSFAYFCAFHFGVGMTGNITVTGGGGNNPPVVTNPGTQNGEENVFFSTTVFATDPNGDPLTMTDGGTTPAWATFVDNGNNSATISGTPGVGDFGTYNQTVTANDGLLIDSESFDIVIDQGSIFLVELTGGGFVPDPQTINVGQSIRWMKNASGNHTTTNGIDSADPNAGVLWDAPLSNPSPTFDYLFNSPGDYPYFCDNHETTENGTITVLDTVTTGVGDDPRNPARNLLLAPHPNPFQSTVVLSFDLDRASKVRIDIFDLSGRRVREFLVGEYEAGRTELTWAGRDDLGRLVGNGLYFVRMETQEGTTTRKIFKTK